MIRRAFAMRLKPNSLAEYKFHHDNIWPELVAEIEKAGIASITTFQDDDNLFLVSEIEDEEAWDKLWNSEIHRRWAEVMEPLMHLRDDGIVDAHTWTEVFHLTTNGNGKVHASMRITAELPEEEADEPGSDEASSDEMAIAAAPARSAAASKKTGTRKSPAKKAKGKKASSAKKAHHQASKGHKAPRTKAAKTSAKKAAKKTVKKPAKKKTAKTSKAAKKTAKKRRG